MKNSKVALILFFIAGVVIAPSFLTFERTTTIVVVDGKALLVDLDEKGEIVTTYMEVSDYFENTNDHDTKVLEAKATYRRLSKEQMDQIRFIALADEGWSLDEFMKSNLADLATHYHQTYANQIEITVATHPKIKTILTENLQNITALLESYGVAKTDIIISYKKDMGEEPTRFIKVVSNLKELSSIE